MRKSLALAFAFGVALAQPAASQPMEETSIAMPVLTISFAPTYIADELGFWTKRGLKVSIHDIAGIGSMNAVLAGSIDFTNSSGPTVIRAYVRGQKLLGIGSTGDNLPFDIVMNKDVAARLKIDEKAPIEKRAQSLKGLTIGIGTANSIPHGYLRYFAKKGGLNPERDFKLATVTGDVALAGIKNGTIDAFVQVTPIGNIAVHQGQVLLDSAQRGSLPELLPMAFNIIATRGDFCVKKPTVCQRIMDGYYDGMVYMHDHPKESLELLGRKLRGLDPEILKEAYDIQLKATPRSTKINDKGMINAQNLSIEAGMIKDDEKLAKFDDVVTNKFAK
jgi:NitT/TauT family transport system substrate-binding protein